VKSRLHQLSERARHAGLPGGVEDFPMAVQRFFSNISGFEPAEFIRRLLPAGAKSALVVGVGAGRDAYWLTLHGLRVVSLDIAEQDGVPNLVLADMAALPFAPTSFDVVIVADALEHTFADLEAVCEFRRVLTQDGTLVLNVPFGDDAGEHHVRVYTEATLRRLLTSAGFRIDERRYRGVFPIAEQRLPGFRAGLHGAGLVGHLMGQPVYQSILVWCTELDWRHANRAWARRVYKGHGAYVKAHPVLEQVDYRDVNRRQYRNQGRQLGRAVSAEE
jgi:SAM-dependent methyltransferase